jgi:NAD(P)H-nitrite reductase large subunit
MNKGLVSLQDTNDKYLGNIQRNGTYSVVPRIPGGEITPSKLIVLGEVAERFKLYTKITGGQRIDLFGARKQDLPDIWEALVHAGFESGHAYGKSLRTVKSCVGSVWCRFGQVRRIHVGRFGCNGYWTGGTLQIDPQSSQNQRRGFRLYKGMCGSAKQGFRIDRDRKGI